MNKEKFSMIDNVCLSKMTDKEMQSWNNELFSLLLSSCFSTLSTSLYGIYPFKDTSTTIAFFIALFFYGTTLICIGNLFAKEKRLPLINNKKKIAFIISIIIIIHLLGFSSSFLILKSNVNNGITTITINILFFILFALIIFIPLGLLLNHFFISPINKKINQFRNEFDEDKQNT